MEKKKQRLEDWDNQIKIAEAEGKDTYLTRSKWYKNKIAVAKKEGEETKAIIQEQAEFEARRRAEIAKKATEDAKKASDEAKKRAEEAQKKAEEAERKKQEFKKQQDALLLKYTDEIQKLTVEKMEDGFEKEKKAIEADAKSKIEQLKKSYNVVDNYNKGFREQEKRNLQNHLMEQKKQRLDDWDNQIKIAEAEGKDTYEHGQSGIKIRLLWLKRRAKIQRHFCRNKRNLKPDDEEKWQRKRAYRDWEKSL